MLFVHKVSQLTVSWLSVNIFQLFEDSCDEHSASTLHLYSFVRHVRYPLPAPAHRNHRNHRYYTPHRASTTASNNRVLSASHLCTAHHQHHQLPCPISDIQQHHPTSTQPWPGLRCHCVRGRLLCLQLRAVVEVALHQAAVLFI